MTGLNIPFCDGDDIVEDCDAYGFTTTVREFPLLSYK